MASFKLRRVRCSFPHLFAPDTLGKYGLVAMLSKEDPEHMKTLEAMKADAAQLIKDKFSGKVPKGCKSPFKDGDDDDCDRPEYAGHFYIPIRSQSRPGVVDQRVNPVTDDQLIMAGDYVNISFNLYAYDTQGNKGVAAGLNNVQFVAKGESLGSRKRAEDEFEAIEVEADEDGFDVL